MNSFLILVKHLELKDPFFFQFKSFERKLKTHFIKLFFFKMYEFFFYLCKALRAGIDKLLLSLLLL